MTNDEGNENNLINSPTELQVDDNDNDDWSYDNTHQEEREEAPSTIEGDDNNLAPHTRLQVDDNDTNDEEEDEPIAIVERIDDEDSTNPYNSDDIVFEEDARVPRVYDATRVTGTPK